LRKLALGRLRWTPEVYYTSTLAELHDALAGFNELENDRAQLQIMQTRKMIAYLVNIHVPRGEPGLKETDIWPLPLDEKIDKKQWQELGETQVILGKDE